MSNPRFKRYQRLHPVALPLALLLLIKVVVPLYRDYDSIEKLSKAQAKLDRAEIDAGIYKNKLASEIPSGLLTDVARMDADQVLLIAKQMAKRDYPSGDRDTPAYAEQMQEYKSFQAFDLLISLHSALSKCEWTKHEILSLEETVYWWRWKAGILLFFVATAIYGPTRRFLYSPLVAPFPAGYCPGCYYNIKGNQSGICPECGRPVVAERHATTNLQS